MVILNPEFKDFTPEQKLVLRNIMMSFVLAVITADEYHLVADGSLEQKGRLTMPPLTTFPTPPEPGNVYHVDALSLLKALPDNHIDLVVTSPPYDNLRTYNGYSFDFEAIARETYRVMKPGGVVVWVVGDATINGSETLTSMRQALYFVDVCGFKMHDTMIYEVAGTGAKGSNLAYWQAWEYMFVLVKGNIKTVNRIADVKNKTIGLLGGGRYRENGNNERRHFTQQIGIRTNVWRYSVGFADKSDKTEHPAPFPESLARDHILTWSNPDDLVLDYFGGSGTTAKMARQNNRRWLTCDISEEYCDLMRRRLAQPFTLNMFEQPPPDAAN